MKQIVDNGLSTKSNLDEFELGNGTDSGVLIYWHPFLLRYKIIYA